MTSEEGPKTEELNQNNNKTIDKSHNNELTKDPYVKELIIKIDVLKKGIIKERKINSDLTSKLKKIEQELTSKIVQLQDELMVKTKEIKTLDLQKEELEKMIKQQQQQPQKKGIGIGFFDNIAQGMGKLGLKNINSNEKEKEKKSFIDDQEEEKKSINLLADDDPSNKDSEAILKLNRKINKLKFENEINLKKLNANLEESEKNKQDFQNEIKTYADKIKSLEDQIKMLKNEKDELQDRIKLTSTISSQTLKETEHFKGLFQEYKKGKEEVEQQLNECLKKYNKLLKENEEYKQTISRHEVDLGKMAKKLSELKNLYIKVNLRNQLFHVKKVGLLSNTEIDIIFGRDDEGNYVMRIDEKDHKELMNIQDVEYVNRIEGSKNKVEIGYMYKAKKYKITVLVDELVVEQFVEAYKIFYLESMKDQNKIAY
jgi:chromosome segregation ATPase